MSKVLCTLENAWDLINGVAFASTPDGMLSEDVSDEVAAGFAGIPGYSIMAAEVENLERDDLLARAGAIDFKTKSNWSIARLRSEVEEAERKASIAKDAVAATADGAKSA